MDRMQKQVKVKFGRKYFLLGRRKDGKKVWLEQGSWNCGWYWGFGYLEVFTRNGRTVEEFYHFSSYFVPYSSAFSEILDDFEALTLSEDELWTLVDLMKSFYVLRDTADITRHGYAYISSDAKRRVNLENPEVRKWALHKQLELIKAVQKLLCPEHDKSWEDVIDEDKFKKDVR